MKEKVMGVAIFGMAMIIAAVYWESNEEKKALAREIAKEQVQNGQACVETQLVEDEPNDKVSYDDTLRIEKEDQSILYGKHMDFSDIKIACVGDSLTSGIEEYTPYPEILKELLNAKEVYNLGLAGSGLISKGPQKAICQRYQEIPKDANLIVIFGGTNDSFSLSRDKLGDIHAISQNDGTFCGDLKGLMENLRWDYPNTKIYFVIPPKTYRHKMTKEDNANIAEQNQYAKAILTIAKQQNIEVIDFYYNNLLNTYDNTIVGEYMADYVHGNTKGNTIIAQHIAADIIRSYK